MKHYGDITKINGAEVEPVWVVIGGSPCQDLSVAGRRAGLQGERSGLFMEQIRIIKEMREADERRGRTDEHIRPRYMVWENVPGALSSNGGEDFRVVLEETARVKNKTAVIPRPPKGKWSNSGCIVGNGWSIAWRIRDAQFWGVPQRRRRIALVADFGAKSAPEILFECEGSSRHYEQKYAAWKEITRNSANGVGEANAKVDPAYCIQGNLIDRADTAGCNGRGWTEGVSYTLNTVDRPAVTATFEVNRGMSTGRNRVIKGFPEMSDGVVGTLDAHYSAFPGCRGGQERTMVYCVDEGGGKSQANVYANQSPTLTCTHGGEPVAVYEKIILLDNHPLIMVQNDDEIIRIRPSIVQSGQERSI